MVTLRITQGTLSLEGYVEFLNATMNEASEVLNEKQGCKMKDVQGMSVQIMQYYSELILTKCAHAGTQLKIIIQIQLNYFLYRPTCFDIFQVIIRFTIGL